jgi:SAM-dependent methyltransferase
MSGSEYFQTRFSKDPRREVLWQTLCEHYFNKLIGRGDHVLELGAGYGYFINNVRCARRSAIDLWEGLEQMAAPGVATRIGAVTDLSFVEDGSVDFVFASNLFEHIPIPELEKVLGEVRRVLRPGGTLNLLQPNYRECYREYFDDYTHVTVFSDISLCDFLEANGFTVTECRPRFLPLTIKSRIPVSRLGIRLYLMSPWKPMGKQMLVRARVGR